MHRALELLRSARFAAALPFAEAAGRIAASHQLDLSRARARCGFSRGHLLDIVVYVPGGQGNPVEQAAAEELVELVIGEELFERWVGKVAATPTVRGGPLNVLNANPEERSAFPIAALTEAIRAAIAGLQQGLALDTQSASPVGGEDWVLFELNPEPAADYAAQDDLLFTSTCLPELKKSFLRGERVFSGRFSNSGAVFTYLKYESAAPSGGARLAERAALEERMSRSLARTQGELVGVGLGARYMYLDLALRDPDSVAGLIVPALRSQGIGRRAWLLFYDSELEREWIGAHADTPEPFWG